MKKYEVRTDTLEFNPDKFRTPSEIFNYWLTKDNDSEIVAFCDTFEKAQATLAKQTPSTYRLVNGLARATIFYIESAEYFQKEDGEWEFISGSDYDAYAIEALPEEEDEEEDED